MLVTLFRKRVLAAALAIFTLSACSENTRSESADSHHAGAEAEASGQVVVHTPDYAALAAPVKDQMNQVLRDYLEVKDALVASDATAAQERATAVVASAQQVNTTLLEGEARQYAEEQLGQITESASKIAQLADLGVQREEFQPLSESVFALSKAFGAHDQKLYYQHCSMAFDYAGGFWVSANEEIRNPYFGDSMLKCGTNEEVVN
jgi:hypothetical protein